MEACLRRTLKPVDTAAALGSGSTARPPLPQPRASALALLLGSGPSPFEATRQHSKGRPETEDLRPNPLTGTVERMGGRFGGVLFTKATPYISLYLLYLPIGLARLLTTRVSAEELRANFHRR
jgi:hypothetical protein